MTDEEAIKRIKLLQQDECDCIECQKDKEALMVVLNLIEKQDKRIRELETALIDEQLKHSGEIEKKDNDIQRMQSLLDLSDANNIEKDKTIELQDKILRLVVEDFQKENYFKNMKFENVISWILGRFRILCRRIKKTESKVGR